MELRRVRITLLVATCATVALALLLSADALAHGGTYRAPPESAGGPGGGTAAGDRAASVTRWEAWWAKNKEYYLRLSKQLGPSGPATGKDKPRGRITDDMDGADGVTQEDLNREIRERIAQEARRAKAAEYAALFLRALRDESEEVRASAAIALGRSGDRRAAAALAASATQDRAAVVRESAILGLGLLGRSRDVFLLEEQLTDKSAPSRRRSFAALSLGLIGGDEACGILMRFLIETVHLGKERGSAAAEVSATAIVGIGLAEGRDASKFLRDALGSEKYGGDLQPYVILSLGRLAERDALPRLVTLLASDSPEPIRRAAAVAIGKIARPTDVGATDALLGALAGDRDEVTRHFAAVALGALDSQEVKESLWRLQGGPRRTRPFAALSLARLGVTGAAPTLRRLLDGADDSSLASSLCISLGLLKDKESLPQLERIVGGRADAWTKGYAALAIGMIGQRGPSPLLRRALEATDKPALVTNYSIALGMLGDRWVEDYLERRVSGRLSTTTAPAAAVIGLLRLERSGGRLAVLFDSPTSNETQRAYAVLALGMLVDKDEIPRLSGLSIGHDYSLSLAPLDEVLTIL